MAWEPIIDGELAARASAAIDRIADALAELDEPADDLAVFWTYLASVRDDELTQQRTERALEGFARAIDRGYPSLALFEGLAGAGWAAAHVASDAEDLLAAIDYQLVTALEAGWQGPFDLISGVAGFGVYFLERETELGRRGLELVVEYFAKHAEHVEGGLAWRTLPEFLPADLREQWPHGVINCGVAHGVPGVLGVLERIAARSDAPPRTRELVDHASGWFRAQAPGGRFPRMVLGERHEPARTAWCYGDAGIEAVLLNQFQTHWLDLTAKEAGVREDGFCHGAAGLAHMANRRYKATQDVRYLDGARTWLRHVFDYEQLNQGVGGFGHEEDGARKAGILAGSAGVALVLLAAISDVEPGWDRRLLCSDQQ